MVNEAVSKGAMISNGFAKAKRFSFLLHPVVKQYANISYKGLSQGGNLNAFNVIGQQAFLMHFL